MRFVARIGAIFLCVLLTACNTYVQHQRALNACKLNCKVAMHHCEQSCRNNCQNCTLLANSEAAVHFNQYKHQQQLQGSIVALELQSFKDPLQCRKSTCACSADFEMCAQACQGIIHKRLKVVPPC